MKKKYMKPTVRVVDLQHRTCLLTGSPLNSTNTNLTGEEVISIEEDPQSIWGR